MPLRTGGARPPLFCIHPGGGHVSAYNDFAALAPEDQPVYGVQPAERDGSRQFLTVEQLAIVYLRDVVAVQPHGPYQLCGQSFGGLVAYEMARRLASAGEAVHILALLDTHHPAYTRTLSRTQWLQFHFTYFVDRSMKYARNLWRGRLEAIAADALQLVRRKLSALSWELKAKAHDVLGRPTPTVMRSDVVLFEAAWRAYRPKQYDGRLLLFRAEDRTAEYARDPTLGWRACSTGSIDVHTVPGDHLTMLELPHVRTLVGKLTPYLASVAGRS